MLSFGKTIIKKIKENADDYVEIEKPGTRHSFRIMTEFIDGLPDDLFLKNNLIRALNGKKPFRVFKNEIDHSGIYRQQWFDFKSLWLQELVKERMEEIVHQRPPQ